MSALAIAPARSFVSHSLGKWEARFFAFATALLLLHFLDAAIRVDADAASRTLRVVAGFAGTTAFALAYCRLPLAARGSLAAAVGLVALTSGVTMHAVNIYLNGASGGDYTGLAYTLGGGILFVLGVVSIERSIPRLRYRLVSVIPAFAVVVYLVAPVVMAIFLTHTARKYATDADLPIPHQDVTLTTSDGLAIAGWYIPSNNGAAIVLVHGSSGSRASTGNHIQMLVRHGYGILSIDARGHGDSTGDRILVGWGAEEDVRAAVTFLTAQPGVDPDRIGGLGLSMGGEVLLNSQAVDERIAAVVADGAGARTFEEAQLVAEGFEAKLFAPVTWLTMRGVEVLTGVPSATPLNELMPRIGARDTLLISSEVEEEAKINRILHALAPASELWENPDAPHADGFSSHPAEYEARVIGFLDRALLGR